MDDEVARSSLAIQSLHPFVAECDRSSMLRSWLDGDIFFAQYREIQSSLDTECRLRWRDANRIVEIGSITSESTLVLWHCERDIEIAVAVISLVTLASDLDRHTVFYTFGDIDCFLYLFSGLALAMTVSALLGDSLSAAVAR